METQDQLVSLAQDLLVLLVNLALQDSLVQLDNPDPLDHQDP